MSRYVILLFLPEPRHLKVGALGRFRFDAGSWVYVGSARRGVHARVRRHLSAEKKLHWHIDALTTTPNIIRVGALLFPPGEECRLCRRVEAADLTAPVPGFGASDCRAGCRAHLWFTLQRLKLPDLARRLPQSCSIISPNDD